MTQRFTGGARPLLLIGTRNPGKFREYRQLFRDAPFELVSLDDLGIPHAVEETGDTFEQNARLKARTYRSLSGFLTLADDSGLEVDALGGEPGVFSSRYGEKSHLPPLYEGVEQTVPPSANMSDRDRVELLLSNLEGVAWEHRTARFRCVLAIATPPSPSSTNETSIGADIEKWPSPGSLLPRRGTGTETLLVGSVAGMIQYEPVGDEGFGYDPVFYLPSYGKTMGQLPLKEKNRISHRADAVRKAVTLLQLLAES